MAVTMATCAKLVRCDPIILLSYKPRKRYRHFRNIFRCGLQTIDYKQREKEKNCGVRAFGLELIELLVRRCGDVFLLSF